MSLSHSLVACVILSCSYCIVLQNVCHITDKKPGNKKYFWLVFIMPQFLGTLLWWVVLYLIHTWVTLFYTLLAYSYIQVRVLSCRYLGAAIAMNPFAPYDQYPYSLYSFHYIFLGTEKENLFSNQRFLACWSFLLFSCVNELFSSVTVRRI